MASLTKILTESPQLKIMEEKHLGINSSIDEILEEVIKQVSESAEVAKIDLPEAEKAIELEKYVSRIKELKNLIREKEITD